MISSSSRGFHYFKSKFGDEASIREPRGIKSKTITADICSVALKISVVHLAIVSN